MTKNHDHGSESIGVPTSIEAKPDEKYDWFKENERRVSILCAFTQPMTTTQIARRTDIARAGCCSTLKSLAKHGLVKSLNPGVTNWSLYWLTPEGARIQKLQMMKFGKELTNYDFPKLQDWELYAWCCHNHRAAIIRVLTEPLQPSAIKRKACRRSPSLRMSTNNVRDVIHLLRIKDIVHSTLVRKKHHPRYELTELGKKIQILLWRV